MRRFVPVTVLMMVLAATRVAGAQAQDGGTLPNGATIVFEKLRVFDPDRGEFTETEANSTLRLHYFNLAHCNCARAKSGMEQTFKYQVRETANSGVKVDVDFWVGVSCATDTSRTNTPPQCKSVGTKEDIDRTNPGGFEQEFNLFDVVNGALHQSEACQPVEGTVSIWALANTMGSTDMYEYSTSVNVGTVTGEMATSGVDTKPPPLPTEITAQPGEESILLSWEPPTTNNTDVAFYQALCAKLDGSPAVKSDDDAQYVTTASICDVGADPLAKDPELTATTLDNGEMTVGKPTGDFGALDKAFICGTANTGTASSLTIEDLENGTPYQVVLLAIDRYGNYTGTYLTSTITPIPSTDFWEDLHDRGSDVEGGLCLLAETYGDDSGLTSTLRAFRDDTLGRSTLGRWLTEAYYATLGKLGGHVHGSAALRILAAIVLAPVVALALLWHWLTLPGLLALIAAGWLWRRRREATLRAAHRLLSRRWGLAAGGLALVTIGAGSAHAGGYQPYWETTDTVGEEQTLADEPGLVSWHAGIRLGPYIPDIDKQLGGTAPGPYEQMFGGARILPMIDVDRILWRGFGQLGLGLSLGYMQKTAHSFTAESTPTDDPRPRAADTNKFRLIPAALTATYRFTWLDDEYGVPVVPYLRGGLAYYVWWVSLSNGDLAKACKPGSTGDMCSTTKALGGSLGLTGSIGLAIRAERIDPQTAMSMQQSGIQHAGIYAELSVAKVDGFGSDSKLSVGDRTWFAGVDFEF